jgi:hypothetical protein
VPEFVPVARTGILLFFFPDPDTLEGVLVPEPEPDFLACFFVMGTVGAVCLVGSPMVSLANTSEDGLEVTFEERFLAGEGLAPVPLPAEEVRRWLLLPERLDRGSLTGVQWLLTGVCELASAVTEDRVWWEGFTGVLIDLPPVEEALGPVDAWCGLVVEVDLEAAKGVLVVEEGIAFAVAFEDRGVRLVLGGVDAERV